MNNQPHPTPLRIDISKLWAYVVPGALVLIWIVAKVFFEPSYIEIIQEDGVLENLQFLFYMGAAALSVRLGIKFLRSPIYRLLGRMYLVLSLGLAFVALEEISWGQRVFDIETPPELMELNTQQEISIHNLKPVQSRLHLAYKLLGLFCFFGWHLLKIPAVNGNPMAEFIIPDKQIRFYFVPIIVVYVYSDHIGTPLSNFLDMPVFRVKGEDNFFLWRDQEPAELMLSMGFFMFAIVNTMRQKARLGPSSV